MGEIKFGEIFVPIQSMSIERNFYPAKNLCYTVYYARSEFVVKTERCNCTNVYVGTCDIMLVVSLFCGILCDRFYVVESNINSKI